MQARTKIKKESYEPKTPLCFACLSSDRKLQLLGEYTDIYRKICNKIPLAVKSEAYLCWECTALLRRVRNFRQKVEKAQQILSTHNNNKNIPKTISDLTTQVSVVNEYYFKEEIDETVPENLKTADFNQDENINETSQEHKKVNNKADPDENTLIDEKKLELEVKQEIDIDYNDITNEFDSYDYVPLEDIKDENLKETIFKEFKDITAKEVKSKKKKTKKAEGRIKKYKLTRHKPEHVVKRLPIEKNDINEWLERERNSTYYKNLKNKCELCLSTCGLEKIEHHNRTCHKKTSSNPYECEICHQYFSCKRTLTVHFNQHFFYSCCTLCGYKCYNKYNMRSHIKLHDKVAQCLECDATFRNTREFFVHYKSFHTVFECDVCNKKFKKKSRIEKHIFKCHTDLKCDECNVSFSNYRTYSEHQKSKHHINPSEDSYCVQCDRQFDNVLQFNKHVRSAVAHNRERPSSGRKKQQVSCPACPNTYSRRAFMMNHFQMVHAQQARFRCDLCQKPFLNSTRYKDHMMYHHEGLQRARNNICYVCGRGFTDKRVLTNHMRTHTGERPFECPHCDSKFAQKVALKSHIKFIHLKDKRKPDLAAYSNAIIP